MKKQVDPKTIKKEIYSVLLLALSTAISSFGFWIFVYPANFAPGGLDGIATILQKITSLSAGYYSFLLNLPLLIVSWFILKKRYVIYTVLFSIISSGLLILFDAVNFYQYTVSITSYERLIAVLFAAILLGARTGIMLRIGASTGGVDIIACMVQKKFPYRNVERIISLCSYVVIFASYFVYRDVTSVLLAIIQTVITEKIIGSFLKDNRNAMEFKIVTKNPNEIKEDLLYSLKHGATVVSSTGMFSEEENAVIFTVVNYRQIPEFLNVIKKYPDTFVYYVEVAGVHGNFRWGKYDQVK